MPSSAAAEAVLDGGASPTVHTSVRMNNEKMKLRLILNTKNQTTKRARCSTPDSRRASSVKYNWLWSRKARENGVNNDSKCLKSRVTKVPKVKMSVHTP